MTCKKCGKRINGECACYPGFARPEAPATKSTAASCYFCGQPASPALRDAVAIFKGHK